MKSRHDQRKELMNSDLVLENQPKEKTTVINCHPQIQIKINDKDTENQPEEDATVIVSHPCLCEINHHFHLEHYRVAFRWRIFLRVKTQWSGGMT